MCESIDTRSRRSRRSSTGCMEDRMPGLKAVMEDLGPAWVLTGTSSETQHAGTACHASPPPHGPTSPSERNDCICGSAVSGTWILVELATNLWTQVSEKSDLTDVVFVFTNGESLGLHKSVLSARSKVFSAMFESRMKEARESRVFVVDSPQKAFMCAMKCLYTGSLPLDVNDVDGRDVWRIADKYQIDDIKSCLCSLIDEISLPTAAQFANLNQEHALFDLCIALAPRLCVVPLAISSKPDGILYHFTTWYNLSRVPESSLVGISASVSKSLMRTVTNGGLCTFLFAQKWHASNPAASPISITSVFSCVRLEGVSTMDLANVVRPTGLIPIATLRALYDERLKVQAMVDPEGFWAFGSRGTSPGRFLIPVGVATGPCGTIVVSDRDNGRVQLFSQSGQFLRAIGSKGVGPGQLQKPIGVGVNSMGQIICVDSDLNRVQMFNGRTGELDIAFGSAGTAHAQFDQPCGLAVGPKDELIVADTRNNRIQVFSSTGVFIFSFGSFGSGEGQFNLPTDISIGHGGHLIVADEFNHRVQVFTCHGQFLFTFGCEGDGPGQFTGPEFVAVTSQGHICVSDWKQHKIHIFTADGVFVQSIGGSENGPASFREPFGLAVGADDSILVADCLNNRVVVLGPNDTTMEGVSPPPSPKAGLSAATSRAAVLRRNLSLCF